jgi:iron complex outermembrane receptor protein
MIALGAAIMAPAATAAGPADEKIVVTASPVANPADRFSRIVAKQTRQDNLAYGGADLGTALMGVPGVTGSGFAAGASRPVVRGFDATRVLVAENGLGSHDVADLSPDHGTPVDILSASVIEILRGAATLRYGSQAIGGVVNVINGRIPDGAADGVSGEAVGIYTSAGRGGEGAVAVRGGGGGLKFHFDAFRRDLRDYEIPDGIQPNSYAEASGVSFGAAFVADGGSLGLAYSANRSDYGLPSGDAAIDMDTQKLQLRGVVNVGAGAFKKLVVEAAGSDYEHSEVEPDGAIAATFLNEEKDARVEAIFGEMGVLLDLALGLQVQERQVSALGEAEEFLLPAEASSVAGYAFARFGLGAGLDLEAAARVENATREGTPVSDVFTALDFTPVSAALGLVWRATPETVFGLHASSAARAPAVAELFARGPHEGTGTFEIGDPGLEEERANAVEGTARWSKGAFALSGAVWAAQYDGFIYGRLTGNTCAEDGTCIVGPGEELLEVFIEQEDATLWGFEAEARIGLGEVAGRTFGVLAQADMVRGELDGGAKIPRLTPFRIGGGVFLEGGDLSARLKLMHVGERDETAPFETPTESHADLSGSVAWRVVEDGGAAFDLMLVGRNLTDETQRNAASFVKDTVVMPGRDVRIVGRLTY